MLRKNILVIDDSALMRRMISDIIESDERFTVGGTAGNGLEALDLLALNPWKYDVLLLDINMPRMGGIEFLEEVSRLKLRVQVIVVSTIAIEGAAETIRLLELGAFDFVTKPTSLSEARGDAFREAVLSRVACATGVADARERYGRKDVTEKKDEKASTKQEKAPILASRKPHRPVGKDAKRIIVLACSTGGPKALQQVIPKLPKDLNAPMLIVQHMPAGFTKTLAERLNVLSEVTVKEAEDGDMLRAGTVYIAKGGAQLRVVKKNAGYALAVTDEPARNGLRPCADILYESLLPTDFADITCVVMTGMGGDGTAGIRQLNDKSNIYVIGQEASTCTVYGMPRVLFEAGLADEMVPLEKISEAIMKSIGVR